MRLSRVIAGLVLAVASVAVATSVHATNIAERAEVARIRAHFDSVLVELEARDVSTLSREQRGNRARLVMTLADYRDRGVFPRNYDFPDRAMPYFVDRKTGTLCAVAHLLESTGRRDIVNRVAATNNNVWVADLAGDAALARWLEANGLTLAEAARIQVPYVEPMSRAEQARNVAFIVAAPTALGVAAVTSVWNSLGNADGHRRAVSWSGAASGAVAATAGLWLATRSDAPGVATKVGGVTAAVGALSLLVSAQSIARHHEIASAEREAERKRAVAEATFAPLVGTAQSRPTVGATLSLRF
jgi:hypothetical protein